MNKEEREKLMSVFDSETQDNIDDDENLVSTIIDVINYNKSRVQISDDLEEVLQDWVFSGMAMQNMTDDEYCQHVIDKITAPPPSPVMPTTGSALSAGVTGNEEAMSMAVAWVTENKIQISLSDPVDVNISGQMRRQYHPRKENASADDIISARLQNNTLIIVLSDGQKISAEL